MEMYTNGNRLMISAENLPEFQALIEKAKKEAEQLDNTLRRLSNFEISLTLSVCGGNQTGGVDCGEPIGIGRESISKFYHTG